MNNSKLRKKKFIPEAESCLEVRHQLIEEGLSLNEAIIIEFMFKHKNSSNLFLYSITDVVRMTGISKPVIYNGLKKFLKANFIERNDSFFGFTYYYRELHEEMCDFRPSKGNSYSVLAYTLRDKYQLSNLEYCVLDSFRSLTKDGRRLRSGPEHFAKIYNITTRTYYSVRSKLYEEGFIIKNHLNFLTLEPEIQEEMELFLKKCKIFSQ